MHTSRLWTWFVVFAHVHSAIFVSPDHRSVLEAQMSEILEDVDDFWRWLKSDLSEVVKRLDADVEVNYERVLETELCW